MRVLGLDPSLRSYGWALHDTDAPAGDPSRCIRRGRIQTTAKMEFIPRYVHFRTTLYGLLEELEPDRVGIEYPVFDSMFSSGMYGLFLYSCEAIRSTKTDVVFWSPPQVKAEARELIERPPKWPMGKPDMIEAAKADAGGGRWSNDEADAYHVARLSGRFWLFFDGILSEDDLTPTEKKYFTLVHTYVRGKKEGRTVKKGVIHRENDRFFLWSQLRE